jgi:lauroyl/myristoyl acyltransferase
MSSAPLRLVLQFKVLAAWAGFCSLRLCERILPMSALRVLLWPPAAVWALVQFPQRKLLTYWRQFPRLWRPRPARFFLRQSLGFYHARLIYSWPDRLTTPSWLGRCYLEGGRELIKARQSDRGVVFASLHFGPFELLPYWLRSHGIVTTMVRGLAPPNSLKSLTHYQYSLSPPAEVPVFLLAGDMTPLPRFAHIQQILGPGRRLLLTVDANRGVQFEIPFQDRVFRMASGAIRLAAMADATLIPCLITETAPWKFTIHFGTSVPQTCLGQSPDLQAAGTHLLREFSQVITRYPEQCRSRLLSAFSQRSET